jgi:hypothetical protein
MAFVKTTSTISSTAVTVSGLTGGTNGKIVRVSGTNTATDAANTDTATQLTALLIKVSDVYYAAGVVPGLSGLTAGSPYFLDGSGGLTATPPTPSSSVRNVYVGFAINTTDLLFRPQMPISGSA